MSLLGRPRKPTEQLIASGAFKKNPQRARPVAPKSNNPAGDAPEYLNPAEKDIWIELVLDLPVGVATATDRSALGLLCMLEHSKRCRAMKQYEIAALQKMYSLFGLTPSDRSRIIVAPDDKAGSEFAEFK